MRILILGGGTVGTWIADLLCRNRHSVTVVDISMSNTRRINNELDVRVGDRIGVPIQRSVSGGRHGLGSLPGGDRQ